MIQISKRPEKLPATNRQQLPSARARRWRLTVAKHRVTQEGPPIGGSSFFVGKANLAGAFFWLAHTRRNALQSASFGDGRTNVHRRADAWLRTELTSARPGRAKRCCDTIHDESVDRARLEPHGVPPHVRLGRRGVGTDLTQCDLDQR